GTRRQSVPSDRLLRILHKLAAGDPEHGAARLSEVSADVVVVSGAGMMLMSGATQRGSVCSCNQVSALIEDLQYTLGEGPCVDAQAVLDMQSDAPPGTLRSELDAGSDSRFVVHQALGRVSAQLGVSVGEALVRLRAYAFALDRLLTDLADARVSLQLRFDEEL